MTPLALGTAALVHPPETSAARLPDASSVSPAEPTFRLKCELTPPTNLVQSFRHSGWRADRRRVYDALNHAGQSASRLDSFARCGGRAYVYRSLDDPSLYRIAGSACHDRFCMPCTRERAQAIAANVRERLAGQRARFLTLTIRTEGLDLRDGLTKLQHAFRRLQASSLWRSRVDGGVAFLEAKYNPDPGRWHPHVHAIIQGRYLPHDQLARTWKQITGDSHIVRIVVVKSHEAIAHYVTTYCSKTLRTHDFPTDAALAEAVAALHRRRLCRTFGTWRGLPLTEPTVSGSWQPLGLLADILRDAAAGDPHARDTIAALATAAGRQFLLDHPPRPPPLPFPAGRFPDPQTLLEFAPLPLQN